MAQLPNMIKKRVCDTKHIDKIMVELQVSPQGRVVIPAELRKAWKIEPGEILLARLENDRLIIEKPAQIVQRIKARYTFLQDQPSLADELVAERHAAVQLEQAE